MVLKQRASTIQSRPVKNIRKVGKKEQNEANCTNLFTCNCKITTDKLSGFRRRTSHELYFNTRFQLPSSLRAVKYNFNILVNSQMQCSHVIQTQAQKCTLILMPFAKETASLQAKPAKHKLHLSAQSSLPSETRQFDALTHSLYFCVYSGLQNTLKIH